MSRSVTIALNQPETVSISWLETFCATEIEELERKKILADGDGTRCGDILVKASAQPPFEKFNALLEADDKLKQLWEGRKRTGDTTQSGYDMSLACLVLSVEWTDQEIVDLLVAHRKKRIGEGPEKASYYQRTIERARKFMAGVKAKAESKFKTEAEENIAADVEQAITGGRSEILALLREKLEVNVVGFIQRDGDPATHYLVIEGHGEVPLGSTKLVLSVTAVRAAILEATGLLPPHRKQKSWDEIVRLLFSILERIEISEGRRGEETKEWIRLYFESSSIPDRHGESPNDPFAEAVRAREPFMDSAKGTIHFTTYGLLRWLKATDTAMVPAADMRSRISEVKFKSEPVTAKFKGRVYCRSYWGGTSPEEPSSNGANSSVINLENLKNQHGNNGIPKT